jgi:hypothetical protein
LYADPLSNGGQPNRVMDTDCETLKIQSDVEIVIMSEIVSNRNKIHFHETFPILAFSLHQQMDSKTSTGYGQDM